MDHSLEKDLEQLRDKLADKKYAQAVYAALCNNEFIKEDKLWSCTWRYAGGIVARLRGLNEDYMHYYCSGILDDEVVIEGEITDEVREDFADLGWSEHQIVGFG